MQKRNLVIIGAGPAGMAAAARAAGLGLSVTLLDEQPTPGGQIYRNVTNVTSQRGTLLGSDYLYGRSLATALNKDNIEHCCNAVVWSIEEGHRISYTRDGRATQLQTDYLLLATGALERPMPIPGWTLPGVMTAGAGQILLKQSGVVARSAVLVGSGPLLYLVAAQMIRAGRPPRALIETQTRSDLRRAMRHWTGALKGWRYPVKGLKMLLEIRRAGVPRHTAATHLAIEGTDKARAITFQSHGREHRIECDTVMLHHGVVPNTQAARAMDLPHDWSDQQHCFIPRLDEWGQGDVEGVFVAGDGAGIGGARVAELGGHLAALQIAHLSNRLDRQQRDQLAATLRAQRDRELDARPFLDAAYPPCAQALRPADTTLACRCEEVTAGDIRTYARLGCRGPNQLKAFTRAGMGQCQGRYCGLTVTSILAEANDMTPDDTGYYRIRTPIKPVSLGELATMNEPVTTETVTGDQHD
ncbi:NAD(P)/FAD-dependent oxidoreductase [Kushneria konosiri]|uniref:FAD/NAD(P)-binding oxidoreductase n=1 Tax=Kushneria konosiri TaxID=698828 RepID=A0A2Z2HGJ1_9GAMM|nr:FAD/NAD(P)-binding oxidoreductase [Kushneria konosiri]ARS54560.1 FAD/NAD(P)-binding oxidoreductase [Kushneria konosiri]